MEAHSKDALNEGSPTPAVICDQNAGISTPDVSLVDTAMADRFSSDRVSRDHLPLLLTWDKDIKVEHDHTRRRHN